MVFEFGLKRKVSVVHLRKVHTYPLGAVRVRRTQPSDGAWIVSKCVNLRCRQVECLGAIPVLRHLCWLLARKGMCLLISDSPATTSSYLAREFFRLEGWTGVGGEVSESFAEFPSLHFKGAECVFGVLPELRVRVPSCHVKYQIENVLVVWRKEESIKNDKTTL